MRKVPLAEQRAAHPCAQRRQHAVPVPLEGDQAVGAADGEFAQPAHGGPRSAPRQSTQAGDLVVLGVGILQRHGGANCARGGSRSLLQPLRRGRLRRPSVDGYAAFAVSRGLDEGLADVGKWVVNGGCDM